MTSSASFDQVRLVITTTYPEPAIVAVAKAAARRGRLVRLYTTLRSAPWMATLARRTPVASVREPLRRELVRRSLPGVPPDAVVTVAGAGDLVHRGARLMPGSEDMAQRLEHRVKERFDHAAAGLTKSVDSNTVVSLAGSAQETLLAARQTGRRAVLHLVNNHPAYRNRFMRELGHLPPGHHELIPERMAARVDRELEVADLVLVPSRAITRQLVDLGIPPERVVLEPYGVDPGAFYPAQDGPGRAGALRCLFVGNVCHGKGIRFLIEAAQRLRGWPVHFLLVGPLRAPELLRAAPDNVEWVGGVLHNEVAEWMRRADLFVMPSIEDAYPLVTLEAMACGLPVIVSNQAGTSELITPGVDGLIVRSGATAPLVAAIQRLIEDAALRRKIGEAGRRKIAAGLTWEGYADNVLRRLQAGVEPRRPLEAAPA